MDENFKRGFNKTAAPVKHMIQKLLKGPEFKAGIESKRIASKAMRDTQKNAIRGAYGGSLNQAGAVRMVPASRPLLPNASISPHAQESLKGLNEPFRYHKAGIGINTRPKKSVF